MNKRVRILIIFAMTMALAFFVAKAVSAADIPQYKGYVNDFANVISDTAEKDITQKIEAHDKKTTNQIAVATVKTTQPEEIEQYSIRMAEQWKPGTKEKDNGVIMLFAIDDRKMRIEVGRGLEGDLTDIESRHILDDTIRPEFRNGNYDAGITKGVEAVILAIDTPEASASGAGTGTTSNNDAVVLAVALLGVVLVLFLLAISELTPFGGEGDKRVRGLWVPKKGSKWGEKSIGTIKNEHFIPIIPPILMPTPSAPSRPSSSSSSSSDDDDDSSSGSNWGGISVGGGSFGGFGGGSFSGGGSSSGW